MNDILLIAEKEDIIRAFTTMLSPAFNVVHVAMEQKGVEILKKDYGRIAAVLVELDLARKSGFIFSNYMQEYSSLSAIPLIAISDSYPDDEEMDCIEHGFFDLICEKSPKQLVYQRIKNAIRAKGSMSLIELEKMLKEFPSCIYLKDAEGRYVFSTQYWRHLETGDDSDWTIRGKTDLDIRKDKENAKKAIETDRRVFETGKGTDYIIEENEDGIAEYLQLIKRPVFDDTAR